MILITSNSFTNFSYPLSYSLQSLFSSLHSLQHMENMRILKISNDCLKVILIILFFFIYYYSFLSRPYVIFLSNFFLLMTFSFFNYFYLNKFCCLVLAKYNFEMVLMIKLCSDIDPTRVLPISKSISNVPPKSPKRSNIP